MAVGCLILKYLKLFYCKIEFKNNLVYTERDFLLVIKKQS